MIFNNKSKIPFFVLYLLMFTPVASFAAPGDDIVSLGTYVGGLFTASSVLFVSMAIAVFLYGVLKYVGSGDNEEKRTEARSTMVYGIVVLFVMVSLWGLVNFLGNTFNFDNTFIESANIPTQ